MVDLLWDCGEYCRKADREGMLEWHVFHRPRPRAMPSGCARSNKKQQDALHAASRINKYQKQKDPSISDLYPNNHAASSARYLLSRHIWRSTHTKQAQLMDIPKTTSEIARFTTLPYLSTSPTRTISRHVAVASASSESADSCVHSLPTGFTQD